VLGDDQRSPADGGGDDSRHPDVELVGVDDVRPPAGHEQTCQNGEDGHHRHQRLQPRTRHGADLDPERPEAVLVPLRDYERTSQARIPTPCDNNHIVLQRYCLCLIAAEAAQAGTIGPGIPRREDEDAPRRLLVTPVGLWLSMRWR
jgi:hypothetical protein